ncbi:hypothetical protein [Curtobacterium luteum]|uniref:hypothetical protein n=1 Tax=Curtobacterium luteum TaxID=33881 RepID=UPI00381EFF6F
MHKSCPRRLRHGAAIGAAVAVVAASSAFGIGATAAVADDAPASASATSAPTSATDVTTDDQPGGTAPDPTSAHPDGAVTPGAGAGGDGSTVGGAPDAPTVEQPDALAFPDGTSADAPLLLEATAGDAVDRTFTASGGTGAVTYELRGAGGKPIVGDGSFDNDFTLDPSTGRLSGTARLATVYDFQVVASSGSERAVEHVRLTVRPGAPVGVTFGVSTSDGVGLWQVETDGTIWEEAAGQGRVRIVPEVPVVEGTSLVLAGLAVDAYGNRTTPGGEDDPYPRSTVTSTVPGDRAVWSDTGSNTVSFRGAGARTLTVTEGGVSTSFRVEVGTATESFGFAAGTQTRITGTAGEPFTADFPGTGAGDDLRYTLRSPDGTPYDAPDGLDVRIDPRSGTLTGSATLARTFHLSVVATGGGVEAVVPVELTVAPAAFDHFTASVRKADAGERADTWTVEGTTVTHFHGDPAGDRVTVVPARQGDRMVVFASPTDRFGNTPTRPVEHTITSDVASDRFGIEQSSGGTTVTFTHASRHVVTIRYEGGSLAVPFEVSPVAGPATGQAATGTLAYTGSDSSGPLAWALGLLAAGGGLLVHRLRRRRA